MGRLDRPTRLRKDLQPSVSFPARVSAVGNPGGCWHVGFWIPAFAGMTVVFCCGVEPEFLNLSMLFPTRVSAVGNPGGRWHAGFWIPAFAGMTVVFCRGVEPEFSNLSVSFPTRVGAVGNPGGVGMSAAGFPPSPE